ncbi:MAG: hypothetical protein ACQEXX_12565 [Bacillota bacterium]
MRDISDDPDCDTEAVDVDDVELGDAVPDGAVLCNTVVDDVVLDDVVSVGSEAANAVFDGRQESAVVASRMADKVARIILILNVDEKSIIGNRLSKKQQI